MGFQSNHPPLLLLIHGIIVILIIIFSSNSAPPLSYAQPQPPFRCSSSRGATCEALVDYVSPNATTLSSIQTLFTIRNLRSILGANNLPFTTPPNFTVSRGQTVRIPFPCTCPNNRPTGVSNHRPIYTVVPDDGLYHIAAEVFSRLVTFQDIQAVNNISDPDKIKVGQKLWIPLPCSCDDVDGQQVVHYGYVVPQGSSVEGIAQQFNTSEETLLRINNLTTPQSLLADSVLDVPLRACSSAVSNSSRDYPLLVPNGTYTFTANNCVRCRCDAGMNWVLQCEPAQINASCPALIRCEGAEGFNLGNTTASGCNRTTCAYAGYTTNGTILTTTLSTLDSTCSAPDNNKSSAIRLGENWRWNMLLILVVQALLLSTRMAFL